MKNASDFQCRCPYISKKGIKSSSCLEHQQQYMLRTIAKNNIFSIDIYQHYFSSIYTKVYFREAQMLTKLDLQHISCFFTLFMDIVMLRALPGIFPNLAELMSDTLKDVIDTQTVKPEDKRLIAFIKAYINEGYEGRFRQFALPKDMKNKNYFDSARAIEEQIDNLLKELKTELDDPIRFNIIKEREVLPNKLSDKEAVRYIKRNFNCIRNIQVLRKSLKKDVWDEFYEIVRKHFLIIVYFRMETLKPIPQHINGIILPKYSSQNQPILTPLLRRLSQIQRNSLVSQAAIFDTLSKNIVQLCRTYHQNTKGFLPNFSINDIFMDQKKLSLGVSYTPLLIDAIGFKNNVKNFELRIATEATALGLNLQETYLQTVRNNKILLNRKYYNPRKTGNNAENEEENVGEEQKMELRIQKKLQEQIHVLRIINIIYFIQNGRHFANDYYYGNVKGLQQIQGFSRPFYMIHYQEMLKEIYQQLKAGIITLKKIIPLSKLLGSVQKDFESSIIQENNQLTLNFLQNYHEVEVSDSLLQNLKSQKSKEIISERRELINQIYILFTHHFSFKKLSNPNKYFVLYYLYSFQEAQFLKKISSKFQETENSAENNKHQNSPKKKQILDVNSSEQIKKQKQYMLRTYSKLIDYSKEDSKNWGQMMKLQSYPIQDIKICIQSINQLVKIQSFLEPDFAKINLAREYFDSNNLANFNKQPDFSKFEAFIADFKQENFNSGINENTAKMILDFQNFLCQKIQMKLNTVLMRLRKLLKSFISSQIQPSFNKADKLHECPDSLKNNKQKWLQMCNYFNVKFRALTRTLLYLDDSTFLRYRSIFRNNLIEEKLSGPKLNAEKIDDLPIPIYTARLQLILEKIEDEISKKKS